MMLNTDMVDSILLDPRLLVSFAAVFEERNISRAAERLGRTQQGTSGALARLREVFGDPLFVRNGYGVEPTPRAEELYPAILHAIRTLEQVLDTAPFRAETVAHSVRIAAADYALATALLPVIRELSSLAPLLDLQIETFHGHVAMPDLGYQGVDLIITVRQFLPPNLHAAALHEDRYVLAMRQGHPLAEALMSLDNFCAASHLLVAPNKGDRVGITDVALQRIGRSRRVSLVVPVFSLAPKILSETDLISVLPARLVSDHNDQIIGMPLPIDIEPFEVMAVWPDRVHQDPLHIWFRELLRVYVGDR